MLARHQQLCSTRRVLRVLVVCTMTACCAGAWAVDADKAARFYEDGLARFEHNDVAGAVIQLKNALQQDPKLLAAHVLLGKALLSTGDAGAAEVSFNEALRLGVSRSEVAVPLARALMLQGRAQAVIDRVPPDGLPTATQVEMLAIRGVAYADLGNMVQASKSFEQARGLDPNSVVPLLAEAPVLLSAGRLDQAQVVAEKAMKLAPNNADAWNIYGEVAHGQGDLAAALDRYAKALQLNPKHVEARLARASILLEQQRDAEAEKDLEVLHQQVPAEARATYLRAVLAGRRGQSAEVARLLGEVVKVVDALPRAWINNQEQFLMLGATAHHGLGQYSAARAYLDTLIGHNSRHYAARKLLASIYLDQGDLSSADNTLDPVLRDVPNDGQALYLKGQILLAQKRYVQATEMLERAAKSGVDTPDLRAAIGYGQLGLGQGAQGLKSLEDAFASKPGDARIGFALATQYMRQAQSAKAIAVVEAVVKKDPANVAALNLLGVVKGATGDRVGARKAYSDALIKEPRFTPAALNLARLDAAEGRPDDARKRLNAILAANRNDASAMYEMGMLEQRAGRPGEASRWLERGLEQQPKDVRIGVALIDLYLSQRNLDAARKTASDIGARLPDNLDVLAAEARVQIAAGNRAGAVQTMKDMTRMAEFDPMLQVRIGRMQLMASNPSGAAYNAQKALSVATGNLAALSLQADALMGTGDLAKAEAAGRELSARYPNSPEGWRIAGDIAIARNQYPVAVQAYRGAFERDASTVNAQRVAHALLLNGEPQKAAASLETWLAKQPADLGARAALAETYMRAGNWVGARAQYDKVLVVDPTNPVALNNQATTLQHLGDPGALAMAERAYKAAPQDPNVIDTYGWILVQGGQLDKGLRLLRDVRLRLPENPDVRYHLAFALQRLGRRDEARTELQAALQPGARFESPEGVQQLRKALGL